MLEYGPWGRGCALEVGVEEGVVALTAAPEHIVLAAQPLCGVHRRLHLRRRVRVHARIGACRTEQGH